MNQIQTAKQALLQASQKLEESVSGLSFSGPVTHIYNPLSYARQAHTLYIEKFAEPCSILFLGMNPGPFGMAQTGVPFGEIAAVRNWMGKSSKMQAKANIFLY